MNADSLRGGLKRIESVKHFPAALAVASLLLLLTVHHAGAIEKGTAEKPQDTDLKPGQYVWDPKAESEGAVDIIVSLGGQKLSVYRDGVLVARSTISSGRKDYETPPGVYMILEKNVTHHSTKYHEASMPFMERLTWSGLAIHAGNTPGHPESHGCMHVPEDFAKDLYGITQEGDTVLVADGDTRPETTADPNTLFADAPAPEAAPPAPAPGGEPAFTLDLQKVVNGSYLIIFSSADKRVFVYRKGIEIGHADLGGVDGGKPFGDVVYAALAEKGSDGLPQWSLLGKGDGAATPDFKGLTMPPEFRQKVRDLLKPGTTLVLTGRSANNAKPTGGADAED